jgi:hypothetical protein
VATALEQSFLELCRKHDLTSLSVDLHYRPDGTHFFGCYAHGKDKHGQSFVGSCSVNRDTISGVIGEAVANLDSRRGKTEPIALADEALPEASA